MKVLSSPTQFDASHIFNDVFARLHVVVEVIRRRRRVSKALAELEIIGDRTLKDMALTRAELPHVAACERPSPRSR